MENPNDIKLTIRMPASLHKQLTQAAYDNSDSLNHEMVVRLLRSFADSPATRKVVVGELQEPKELRSFDS